MRDFDRFILGDSATGRQYLICTRPHPFIGELFDEESVPPGGLTLALHESGEVLAKIVWLGEPLTSTADLAKLAADIEDYFEDHDYRAQKDVDAMRRAERQEEDDPS